MLKFCWRRCFICGQPQVQSRLSTGPKNDQIPCKNRGLLGKQDWENFIIILIWNIFVKKIVFERFRWPKWKNHISLSWSLNFCSYFILSKRDKPTLHLEILEIHTEYIFFTERKNQGNFQETTLPIFQRRENKQEVSQHQKRHQKHGFVLWLSICELVFRLFHGKAIKFSWKIVFIYC